MPSSSRTNQAHLKEIGFSAIKIYSRVYFLISWDKKKCKKGKKWMWVKSKNTGHVFSMEFPISKHITEYVKCVIDTPRSKATGILSLRTG